MEDRLALLERLKKRYGPSLGEVTARQMALRRELETIETACERASVLEKALDEASAAYVSAAKTLSQVRRTEAKTLASRLERCWQSWRWN